MTSVRVSKTQKILLWVCNIGMILAAIISSVAYANSTRAAQMDARKAEFISTMESMKSVSQNYLDSERGYVENWAAYISGEQMTLEEALTFLRRINTNPNRYAHIVDMDDFSAWSASLPAGAEETKVYQVYKDAPGEWERLQEESILELFSGENTRFEVLRRYRLEESLTMVVSVGCPITLQTAEGAKDYLLLRAIPTEEIQKSWVFPTDYRSAEVGIITRQGDYLIQSSSMKSVSFPEYIRAYNFQEDYNRGEALREQIMGTDSGTLFYRNFRNEDCMWYYSSFGSNSNLDILGVIKVDELRPSGEAWQIVEIVCGTLGALILLDGLYLRSVNRRLRNAVRLANQASEAKTRFLSAMSHDIRTPMNAVLGMMSLAQRNVENTAYVSECLEKALRAGQRLLTLINDVLDISKIESGQFALIPTEVELPELMNELMDVLTPQAKEKGLELVYNPGNMPAPVVFADPTRLNQVFMNLASNAVKYTPEGGKVQISLGEEPLPGENGGRVRLVFRVSDNGIGMSQEFQKTMYQSFSRAVETQVNRTQGSGLGLSIVRQMVTMMHGTITCDSAMNRGTTFTVNLELPVVEKKLPVSGKKTEDGDVSGLNLLIAEDNDLNWEIIHTLLEEFGIRSCRAENGSVCVRLFSEAPPGTFDAVFMDVHMPEMDGIAACRVIRSLPGNAGRKVPIIAMTADAFAEDVQTCLDSGMNGHLAKPIDVTKLMTYLKRIKNGTVSNFEEEET